MSEAEIQERIGAVLHQLAAIEPKAARADESRATRHLLTDFRRLARDLERTFEKLRESAARQEAIQVEAGRATRRAGLLLTLTSVPYLLLHSSGLILDANESASQALNMSLRQLRGRPFQLFLDRDRGGFAAKLERAAHGAELVRWSAVVRPRDGYARSITLIAASERPGHVVVVLSAAAPETVTLTEEDGRETIAAAS